MKKTLWLLPILLASSASADLIVDGNFASPAGPSTFATGYTNVTCGPPTLPGDYLITTNPSLCRSTFTSYTDPANDGGNMLLVDGNTVAVPFDGQTGALEGIVWQETIAVSSGTMYTFTGEVASADDLNTATLALFVNGTQVGAGFAALSTSGTWSLWTQAFTAPSNSVVLSIQDINSNPTGAGNDFSLDNLTLNASSTGGGGTGGGTGNVPEPATWLLACVGLAAIIGCKWREKQAAF